MSLSVVENIHHTAGSNTSNLSKEQQAVRAKILGITDTQEERADAPVISVRGIEQDFRSIRITQTTPSLVSIVMEKPSIKVELAADRPEVMDTIV